VVVVPRNKVLMLTNRRLRTEASDRLGHQELGVVVERDAKFASGVDYSVKVQTVEGREVSAPPVVYALQEALPPPVPVEFGGCLGAGGEGEGEESTMRLRLIADICWRGTEATAFTASHTFLIGIALISGGVGKDP
jgi:hypothetical protein